MDRCMPPCCLFRVATELLPISSSGHLILIPACWAGRFR